MTMSSRQPPASAAQLPASVFTILAIVLLPILTPQPATAQTFSVLYTFNGEDGSSPNGGLVQDAGGNLYGTTEAGGAHRDSNNPFGDGTVFMLDPSGVETVLYSFTDGINGLHPSAGLFRDLDGSLYGTAFEGGKFTGPCFPFGCGTVFKLDTNNVLTVLHTFSGGLGGAFPASRLVSINGVFYGTTRVGGNASSCGVIFKLTKGGRYTVLHRFTGLADGCSPYDLIRDANGNLYGVAFSSSPGQGTVFRLDAAGNFTVLHTFTGGADGGEPVGRLLRDTNGNIHGVTQNGNVSTCTSCGVVYLLDPIGKETVLHRFPKTPGGWLPVGILDVVGSLYGVTVEGGDLPCVLSPNGCGVLFQIGNNTGHYTVLHRFTGGADGGFPAGHLTLGSDGAIYGAAIEGGASNDGVIFRYTP